RAGAHPGGHEALAAEPVVGDGHRAARHAQPPREFPRWRQPIAGSQAPRDDGEAELAVNLTGQIRPAKQTDVNVHCVNVTANWTSHVAWNWLWRPACAANTVKVAARETGAGRLTKQGQSTRRGPTWEPSAYTSSSP